MLLRRLYYDLIGLPPTPSQIADFVQDRLADAWEKVIDQLLASPQYGQRWGRFWLDLARYADTSGYERDQEKPFAWKCGSANASIQHLTVQRAAFAVQVDAKRLSQDLIPEHLALASLCHVLLNCNEFIYVD